MEYLSGGCIIESHGQKIRARGWVPVTTPVTSIGELRNLTCEPAEGPIQHMYDTGKSVR